MFVERRKRWTEALRSGEFEQGTRYLCADGKYCCLGVACEIFKDEAGLPREVLPNKVYYDGKAGSLTNIMTDFLGLQDDIGSYNTESLVNHNDNLVPFAVIADIIDSEPEGLFVA